MENQWSAETEALVTNVATAWASNYPIPAWGLADGTRLEDLAAAWGQQITARVLPALADAGLLLPPGGQVVEQWRVMWKNSEEAPVRTWADYPTKYSAVRRAKLLNGTKMVGINGNTFTAIAWAERRTMTTWADGSEYAGIWSPVLIGHDNEHQGEE